MVERNFWIGVVSRSHVRIGVQGGFIQLNHGKKAPLSRFCAGDGLVIYSPRTSYPDGEPLQAFTAIGGIVSSTLLTLLVVPAAYSFIERFRLWALKRARGFGGLDAAPTARPG